MWLYLLLVGLEPSSILPLPVKCRALDICAGELFLLQENGRTVVKVEEGRIVGEIPVSDDNTQPVRGFKLTPFVLYLILRDGLYRQFLISNLRGRVYPGDIIAFTLTSSEELVLAERRNKAIIFLDSDFKTRLVKKNLPVLDIDYFEQKIYLLTRREVIVLDEYGNELEKFLVPARSQRIMGREKIYLFTPGERIIFVKGKAWKTIELCHSVIDLILDDENLYALNQYGDTLYIYRKADF
ncbi:MAG: hypothetical protein ABIL39_08690 [candidate division WOR-3 bacterium]